jgi:hypothetical protein
MKSIKITTENAAAIEAALKAVNGKAIMHTITTYAEVAREIGYGEKRLEDLGLPKAARGGAVFMTWSATLLPNAYRYMATGTELRLERRSGAWWLADVGTWQFGSKTSTKRRMTLTPAQDAKAIEVLRREYSVARSEGEAQC